MPCRTLTYSSADQWPEFKDWLSARENPDLAVEAKVRDILDTVRQSGDQALVDYTRQFDCPDFSHDRLTVPAHELAEAATKADPADMAILERAAANIRAFHEGQKENSWWQTRSDGTILGQMVTPVDRVGLYVPGGQGGQTPLISSMLMNAIPALVAGVPRITAVTPPMKDGKVHPLILAAAHMLGITEIHPVGSAWAIAALALGTESISPVDVIAGPGNIFVTTAKRLLIGKVGIDMIAGPSEIAILAQAHQGVNPAWLAADMLSQAEHDPQASAICISPGKDLLTAVATELEKQTSALPRGEIAAKSLADWGALVHTPDLDAGIDLVNRLAPEHLELALADPWSVLGRIRNAGAIFMGAHSPEPVGDYFAGPNHVLPTMGTARFSSALSVQNFCKKSSVVAASPAFVQENASSIARLARMEGLEAHARSVEIRSKKG